MASSSRLSSLSGLRVLDLAGPFGAYCGRVLAALGADVLKVEPAQGSDERHRPPFVADLPGVERSLHFLYLDAGKRSTVLDLGSLGGRKRLLELAAEADVLIETWSPAERARLALEGDLTRLNPRLVHTSVTPFGKSGSDAGRRGPHLIVVARSGLLDLSGMPGSPPSVIGGYQGEYHAGLVAAAGTLAALRRRGLTGRGGAVDVSAQEALIFATSNALDYLDLLDVDLGRLGIRNHAGLDMYYRARDRWVLFWLGGRWDALLEWAEEAGFDTSEFRGAAWEERAYREAHPREVRALLESLFASLSPNQIYREGQRRRLVTAPVNTTAEVAADLQLSSREYWLDSDVAELGRPVRMPGPPIKMSATPWRSRPAPRLGSASAGGWSAENGSESNAPLATAGPGPSGGWLAPFPAEGSGEGLPFAGLRVLDLGGSVAVPFATKIMADFGADVIRIETFTKIDGMRLSPPQPANHPGPDSNGTFNIYNTSKRSVLLDLSTESGRALLGRLIKVSDVLVDNFGVDPYPKWGLSMQALFALNPDLIVARSSFMGRSGPDQNYVGLGYASGALAGLHSLTGFPDDPPVSTCTAHSDFSSNPFHIMVAVLAALSFRDRTGKGQVIDMSQHESTIALLGPPLLDYFVNGRIAQPAANRVDDMCPHGVYPSAGNDKWIAVAVETDEAWHSLVDLIGLPDNLVSLSTASLTQRRVVADSIDHVLTAWTSSRRAASAAEMLNRAGVAASPVMSMRDLLADPHLAARGFFRKLPHPVLGERWHFGAPFVIEGAPNGPMQSAPLTGEHTEAILFDLLGVTEDEMSAAYLAGAIG